MKGNKHDIKDLLIFDSHCDSANVMYDQSTYFIKENKAHLTLEKAGRGGLGAQIFALYVNPVYAPHQALKRGLKLYNALEKRLFSTQQAVKVTSTSEMKSALKRDKLACWISLESGDIIENSLDILEFFYTLGIRCMTLTHNKNTDWADSSGDEPKHDGLNTLGRKIVSRMDELGMIIDVSHVADSTVEDVLETSSLPLMASHSCARSLCDIPRNIPDNLIKEIAKRNGFIGVNFFPGFLRKHIYQQVVKNVKENKEWFNDKIKGKTNDPNTLNRVEMELYTRIVKGNDTVDVNAVIDHIIHISNVGGMDCVGLGSDFDGIPSTPTNLTDVSCYPQLVEGLVDRGFNDEEIHKIMGLNLFRFLQQFDK